MSSISEKLVYKNFHTHRIGYRPWDFVSQWYSIIINRSTQPTLLTLDRALTHALTCGCKSYQIPIESEDRFIMHHYIGCYYNY